MKVVDPQTLTPFYQRFCTSLPTLTSLGHVCPAAREGQMPAFQQFCLTYALYSTFELCQAGISLSVPRTGIQKTDVPLLCLCRASVLGNYPHLHFHPAWLHSPHLIMLPGKWPLCCPTSNLTAAAPSHLGSCRRDIQTHPQEGPWKQYLICMATANGMPNPPSVTANSFKNLHTGG